MRMYSACIYVQLAHMRAYLVRTWQDATPCVDLYPPNDWNSCVRRAKQKLAVCMSDRPSKTYFCVFNWISICKTRLEFQNYAAHLVGTYHNGGTSTYTFFYISTHLHVAALKLAGSSSRLLSLGKPSGLTHAPFKAKTLTILLRKQTGKGRQVLCYKTMDCDIHF